jgi:phage terminase small subunit
MSESNGLNERAQAFAAGVASGKSATQAAKDAGYAEGSAAVAGSRLLRKAKVAAEVERLRTIAVATVEAETGITLVRLVEELAHAALLDPKDFYGPDGRLLALPEMPEHARRAIASIESTDKFDASGSSEEAQILIKNTLTKLRPNDKLSAIERIARLLGFLKDKVEHEHKGGVRLVWGDEE